MCVCVRHAWGNHGQAKRTGHWKQHTQLDLSSRASPFNVVREGPCRASRRLYRPKQRIRGSLSHIQCPVINMMLTLWLRPCSRSNWQAWWWKPRRHLAFGCPSFGRPHLEASKKRGLLSQCSPGRSPQPPTEGCFLLAREGTQEEVGCLCGGRPSYADCEAGAGVRLRHVGFEVRAICSVQRSSCRLHALCRCG